MDKLSPHGFGNEIENGIEIWICDMLISYDAKIDF
jgi:hypothetical protein